MAKKKFEEEPYNPLAADLLRDAAIQARRRGKGDQSPAAPERKVVDMQPRGRAEILPRQEMEEEPDDFEDEQPRPNIADRLTRGRKEQAARTASPGTTKRYRVTEEEDYELENFMLQLRRRSNTKVSLAVLSRVTNDLMMQALPEILSEIDNFGPIHQPPKNDALQYGEFEEAWGTILDRALRRRRHPR
jgi:hypothetical protein